MHGRAQGKHEMGGRQKLGMTAEGLGLDSSGLRGR